MESSGKIFNENSLLDSEIFNDINLVTSYTIYFYKIIIYSKNENNEKRNNLIYNANFHTSTNFPSYNELKKGLIRHVSRNLNIFTENLGNNNFWSFKKNYNLIQEFTNENFPEKSKTEKEYLCLFIWFNLLQIQKFAPILLDKNINEIYLLPNNLNIVLDHSVYGRINYFYSSSSSEILNILQKMARENNKDLTMIQPSFKGDYYFKPYFSLRVTGDIQPYSFEGATGNIRKLRTEPFLLCDLIKNNTLNKDVAGFITYLINQFVNITIVGPPNSGKTTLQTALLNSLPEHWRIISFEQTLEYVPITHIHPHLIRYKYPKYQGTNVKMEFFSQITQLLHRSPDFVNLGEITNAEEAFAWYQVLSSGIPSMQTLHGTGMHSIIGRIKNVLKIPDELLAASFPHIIMFINKIWVEKKITRKVFFVGEIDLNSHNQIVINPIFQYDPSDNIIKRVKKFEDLNIWNFLQTKSKSAHIKELFYEIDNFN
ncbi:MAG: ATPase, T2SS/T4P/T4SS family [Candidatus Hodarchaeales archaeon]|jgi:flagellar protein FlaI